MYLFPERNSSPSCTCSHTEIAALHVLEVAAFCVLVYRVQKQPFMHLFTEYKIAFHVLVYRVQEQPFMYLLTEYKIALHVLVYRVQEQPFMYLFTEYKIALHVLVYRVQEQPFMYYRVQDSSSCPCLQSARAAIHVLASKKAESKQTQAVLS